MMKNPHYDYKLLVTSTCQVQYEEHHCNFKSLNNNLKMNHHFSDEEMRLRNIFIQDLPTSRAEMQGQASVGSRPILTHDITVSPFAFLYLIILQFSPGIKVK